MSSWIGFDLDGTLAYYESNQYPEIGEPIMPMVEKYHQARRLGFETRIVTARANEPLGVVRVEMWCSKHLGHVPPITSHKDLNMVALYDDRAIATKRNVGTVLGGVDIVQELLDQQSAPPTIEELKEPGNCLLQNPFGQYLYYTDKLFADWGNTKKAIRLNERDALGLSKKYQGTKVVRL